MGRIPPAPRSQREPAKPAVLPSFPRDSSPRFRDPGAAAPCARGAFCVRCRGQRGSPAGQCPRSARCIPAVPAAVPVPLSAAAAAAVGVREASEQNGYPETQTAGHPQVGGWQGRWENFGTPK